jgi:DNA-binding MarR family transcriptional regulator
VQIRNTDGTKWKAGLHRLRSYRGNNRQKNKMNQRLTYEEKRILRDLSAGQSTVDAIALRFGQTASTIQRIMDRLEKMRMVASKTIMNGKFTVYELR